MFHLLYDMLSDHRSVNRLMQCWLQMNSKTWHQVTELTGCYCGHTDHFQKTSQMLQLLLCWGSHWQPNTLSDENICSNESVPHNLEGDVSHLQLEMTSQYSGHVFGIHPHDTLSNLSWNLFYLCLFTSQTIWNIILMVY